MSTAPLTIQAGAALTSAAYVTAGIGDIGNIGEIIGRYLDFIVLLLTFTPIALLAVPGMINFIRQKS